MVVLNWQAQNNCRKFEYTKSGRDCWYLTCMVAENGYQIILSSCNKKHLILFVEFNRSLFAKIKLCTCRGQAKPVVNWWQLKWLKFRRVIIFGKNICSFNSVFSYTGRLGNNFHTYVGNSYKWDFSSARRVNIIPWGNWSNGHTQLVVYPQLVGCQRSFLPAVVVRIFFL